MPTPPSIAVVVSTYNRSALLPRLVAALAAQRDAPPFEAIIVDDCSADDTWVTLQGLVSDAPFPLTIGRTPENSGPATGRNIGWRSTCAPFVAFTDDDCVPHPSWLASMAKALEEADVVQGLTDVDPNWEGGRGPFARVQVVVEWSGLFDGCNMGYRRHVLERLGGFDERYRRPFGEDVDLGWRAVESGATTAWAPDAMVMHDVETTGDRIADWVVWVRDTRRRRYAPLMVKSHPGLRAAMHRRLFYTPSHPSTLLALAGLTALAASPSSRRHWAAAAAMSAPYVWRRGVVDPRPARTVWLPVVVPMTFVGDLAEVWAMVKGSIRYRTLLL